MIAALQLHDVESVTLSEALPLTTNPSDRNHYRKLIVRTSNGKFYIHLHARDAEKLEIEEAKS